MPSGNRPIYRLNLSQREFDYLSGLVQSKVRTAEQSKYQEWLPDAWELLLDVQGRFSEAAEELAERTSSVINKEATLVVPRSEKPKRERKTVRRSG
jgi:hypothetical protein